MDAQDYEWLMNQPADARLSVSELARRGILRGDVVAQLAELGVPIEEQREGDQVERYVQAGALIQASHAAAARLVQKDTAWLESQLADALLPVSELVERRLLTAAQLEALARHGLIRVVRDGDTEQRCVAAHHVRLVFASEHYLQLRRQRWN